MGSKGRVPPPAYLRRPLPGPGMLHPEPGMLHPDPFGPGVRPPHGAFPFDMLPHPEIMEQKLAAQEVEMQRLLTENRRLASTHSILRHELALAQQELQRVDAQMGAMKVDHEHRMGGLVDKMAKMEADLKAYETIKAELQQAHAEAHNLMLARQELMAKVHHLTKELQGNHADAHEVPALMSEVDNLRQEYQHCRATYDYERKLRIDHYDSLQVMEKNYMSVVREVEKLRAELTNAANLDKSGGSYNNISGYKESDTTGQRSGGQNAYEDVYGAPQGWGPSGGGAVTYGGGPAGAASAHPAGYDAHARGGPVYNGARNPAYDNSRGDTVYANSRGGSFEPPKGDAAGYDVPKGSSGYDAANKVAGRGQVPSAAGNAADTYGATQNASPYGSAQAAQAPNPYGSAQAANPYGSSQAQAANPYGLTQPHAANPYGSTQAQAANTYGSTHTQAANPYGSAQAPNQYGSAQAPNQYGSAQAPPVGGTGFDAPSRGGGGGSGGNMRR